MTNTSHSLHILSDILLHAGFKHPAEEVKSISEAMKQFPSVVEMPLPPHAWPEPESTERPKLKDKWEQRIIKLYNFF